MAKTIVALFDSFAHAEAAVNDLVAAGFTRENVSVVANDAHGHFARNADGSYSETQDTDGVNPSQGASDAVKGAVRGGIYGGLTSLAATFAVALIPGIGPIAAIGPLAALLGAIGVGAAAGGVLGGMTGLGVPEAEAGYYAEGVRRGGTLVTVQTDDSRATEARDILNRFYPVEMHRRAEYYAATGFRRYDPANPALTPEQIEVDRTGYARFAAGGNVPLTTNEATYEPQQPVVMPGLTDREQPRATIPTMETLSEEDEEADDNTVYTNPGTVLGVPAASTPAGSLTRS